MRQATRLERSQEGDNAYAQQHRFEHEHWCTSTEEECPAQKESDKESVISILRQSRHEKTRMEVILCANHHSKSLIGNKHPSSSLQKIYPCEAR
jgi:hypothetical protein